MTPTAADVAGALNHLADTIEAAWRDEPRGGLPIVHEHHLNGRIHARASLALLRAALDAKDAEIQRQGEEMARLLLKLTYPADDDRVALMRMRALLADRERMGRLMLAAWWQGQHPPWGSIDTRQQEEWQGVGATLAAALTAALDGTEGA